MTVAIMQPYFFPYLGYFSLIKSSDLFILLDDVQFIRHGWIERNRVLKPEIGWQYISCPLVKHPRNTLIKDIKIRNQESWKDRILSQLTHYKKRAPYYNETISILNEVFLLNTSSISCFNQKSLEIISSYIGFDFKIKNFNELNINIEKPTMPDEWALNICKLIGEVKVYLNPIGGQSFFDRSKYHQNNIELYFQKYNSIDYTQKNGVFESGLSIIDVMMFNSARDINNMLDNYELL